MISFYSKDLNEPLLHRPQAHPASLLSDCWPTHILCDNSVDQSEVAVGESHQWAQDGRDEGFVCPTYFSVGRDLCVAVELGWRVLYKSSSVRLYWLDWNKEVLSFVKNWCNAGYIIWRVIWDSLFETGVQTLTCTIGHCGLQINVRPKLNHPTSLLQPLGYVHIFFEGIPLNIMLSLFKNVSNL